VGRDARLPDRGKALRQADREFLERVFQKLLINFTWWVNRKDAEGNNIFEGGFLGLDNISVFDRTSGLPLGGYLEQADGTSWMAMYCLNLLGIALQLAKQDSVYEDVATKFFEHFVYIGSAINPRRPRSKACGTTRTATTTTCCACRRAPVPDPRADDLGLIPIFARGRCRPRGDRQLQRLQQAPAVVREIPP
jgi:hypothetical protein